MSLLRKGAITRRGGRFRPWLKGWSYRKSHVINAASNAGTNYQVKIVVHYGTGTDNGSDVYLNNHARNDFGDVRFTSSDQTTLLDYWMEEKVDSDYAVFWVEVADDLSSANQTIYIYYGNASATTTSNGVNTFLLFDDLNDNSLNTTIWNQINGGFLEQNQEWERDGLSAGASRAHINKNMTALNGRFVIRRFKVTSDGHNIFDLRFIAADYVTDWGIDHYRLYVSPYDYAVYFQRYNGGTGTTLYSNTSASLNADTFYRLECLKSGSHLEFTVSRESDNALIDSWSGTDSAPLTTAGYFGARSAFYNTAAMTVSDDLFIAKYVYPEPSHGSWGSEERY